MLSLKGKLQTLASHVEWGLEARCFNKITRHIYRAGDSGLRKDSSKTIWDNWGNYWSWWAGKEGTRTGFNITRDDVPRVLTSCPVIYSNKASSSKGPKGFKGGRWKPTGMNDLKKKN